MVDNAAGVSRNDIASGKYFKAFTGAFDVLGNDPTSNNRPCRAIVTNGETTVKTLNNETVVLPNTGGFFWWDLQIREVVSGGTGVIVW